MKKTVEIEKNFTNKNEQHFWLFFPPEKVKKSCNKLLILLRNSRTKS